MCKVTSIFKNGTEHSEFSCDMFQDGWAVKPLPVECRLAGLSKASSDVLGYISVTLFLKMGLMSLVQFR